MRLPSSQTAVLVCVLSGSGLRLLKCAAATDMDVDWCKLVQSWLAKGSMAGTQLMVPAGWCYVILQPRGPAARRQSQQADILRAVHGALMSLECR